FMRLQVSNPSRPGMTASISTTSGVTLRTMPSAASPLRATRTVTPASSRAVVRKPSDSGESSTRRTMSCSFSIRFMAHPLQRFGEAVEIECLHVTPQRRDQWQIARLGREFGQLGIDPLHMAELPQTGQIAQVARAGRAQWPRRNGRIGLIGPLDTQMRPELVDQLAEIERLGQRIAMACIGTGGIGAVPDIGREHDDG